MRDKIEYLDEYNFAETVFNGSEQAKTESIMSLGNGYLGLRGCAEESYMGQTRGLFIAGTFNSFDDDEVTELPNCADFIGTELQFDSDLLDLSKGTVVNYEKKLNLKKALLTRKMDWSISGKGYSLEFERFVSQKELHLTGQSIKLSSDENVMVRIAVGINGRMTNSGSQHFNDGEKRFCDGKYLRMVTRTTHSGITVFYTLGMKFLLDGKEMDLEPQLIIDRRRILAEFRVELKAHQTLQMEKTVDVRTDRDGDSSGRTPDEIKQAGLSSVKNNRKKGFSTILQESAAALDEKLWSRARIKIDSPSCIDRLAVHFAQYHLHIMTPAHDSRMNIGAKGLSGEGYKGHTFWDTEIFALPYFIFSNPESARKLVEYRYLSLDGARRKARENGYGGAQFPWESAWLDDGEVTPEWGSADIVTGIPLRIESGFIEQHITADVAFGVWQYYKATGDERFMLEQGYELILETAVFWALRLECGEDGLYHINDVMGPDEFKEHVDDNAFTNYMAWWNIKIASECADKLKNQNKEEYDRLVGKLGHGNAFDTFTELTGKIYLPRPREDHVLPQDKTYLALKDIDLRKYKNGNYGEIYKDYNSEQISRLQVSKQADVMLLLLLLEDLFPIEVKKASWNYYEPRTIHDSSLSFSTHAILACDMDETDGAYSFFSRACQVDLGQNMYSCNDGIHAAAMAGIWQSAVFGFAGVRMLNGKLRIIPKLPRNWNGMELVLYWQNQRLEISIDRERIVIVNKTNLAPTELFVVDEWIRFDGTGECSRAVKGR